MITFPAALAQPTVSDVMACVYWMELDKISRHRSYKIRVVTKFNMITFPAALAQPTVSDVMVWPVTEAELMVCRVTKAARIESNRCVIDNILQWNVYWTDLNIGWIKYLSSQQDLSAILSFRAEAG